MITPRANFSNFVARPPIAAIHFACTIIVILGKSPSGSALLPIMYNAHYIVTTSLLKQDPQR